MTLTASRSDRTEKFLTTALLCLLANSVHGETAKKSSLWLVEGAKNRLYLQASIHLLKPEHYPLNDAIDAAFSNSHVIVFEADIGEINKPETAALMMRKGMLTESNTLRSVLSPETHSAVQGMFKELGVDIEMLQDFKPWFLSVSLSTLKLQSLGYSPLHGVDYHFYRRAREQNKTIIGLETVQDQISMLDALSSADQDAMLAHTITEFSEIEAEFVSLVKAWQLGNTQPMETMLLEAYEAFPGLYEKLISDRNQSWLPVLEKYLGAPTNHMVIVGAAHMVGENGLLKLLSSKGYKLRQL